MSSQKEDLEDLQSQLHMLREQNKHLEDQIKKQADRSTQDIQHKDRELEQVKGITVHLRMDLCVSDR